MPYLHRDFLDGTITSILSSGGTTVESAELAQVPVVAPPNQLLVTLDPDGTQGAPEVVEVSAHTAGAVTATVVRGRLGTSPREHLAGTPWVHSFHASELDTALSDIAGRVAKTGDTMTGALTLSGAPTSSLHAATKAYVDTAAAAAQGGAWVSWTPTVTYKPQIGAEQTITPVTVDYAKYVQLGKTVTAALNLRFTGTSFPTFSMGRVLISLPVTAVHVATQIPVGSVDIYSPSSSTYGHQAGLALTDSSTKIQVLLRGLANNGASTWGNDPAQSPLSQNSRINATLLYEAL